MLTIGKKIKSLREQNNWSQLFLAKKVGINNSVLSRIESGNRPVEDQLINKFADAFEVTADSLLGRSTNNQDINLRLFSLRLREEMEKNNLSIEDVSSQVNVTPGYIEKLLNNPNKLCGIGTLYAIAELLNVTADYLIGFTDNPQGRSPHTPKLKDLKAILQEDVLFDGIPMNEDDKQRILGFMESMYWDAKQKNKRKK